MLLELIKQLPIIITSFLTFCAFIIVFKKINKINKLSFGKNGFQVGGYTSHKDCPNSPEIRELWYKNKKVYARREEICKRIMRIDLGLMLDEQKEIIDLVLVKFAELAKKEYLEKLKEIGESLLDKDPQVQMVVQRMYGEFYFYAEYRVRENILSDTIRHNRDGGITLLLDVQSWIMDAIRSLMIGRNEDEINFFIDYGKNICDVLKYDIQSMIGKVDEVRRKYLKEKCDLEYESKTILENLEKEEKEFLGF